MANAADSVGIRLEADRKDLLDLSLRNPLLNYRARSRSLEFIGESSAEVFRKLVREGRTMSFLHNPHADVAPAEGTVEGEQPPEQLPEFVPTDRKFQTSLSEEKLEARLLTIYYASRTSIEEQGVNTLFLALGMLNWCEDDARAKRLRAPLIVVPVALERSSARERFRLRQMGEDVGFNLSLAEKLRADHRITLPELPDADDLDVPAYFQAVSDAVAGKADWKIEADAMVLSFFSFGKLLMYLDLHEAAWPDDTKPVSHPVVRALLGDGFQEPAALVGEEGPLDSYLDPREVRQVVDADSSQILALLDANQGRNFVIQGPPGTGKSQTITNLIAEAVGRGKKVLFVAEKMAALEVVKRRLDAVGLGTSCLELHSHKTHKKNVLAELRRTLESGKPRLGSIDDDLRLLAEVRDRLNVYCEAVNTAVAPSDVTPYEAFGELLRLRSRDATNDTTLPAGDPPAMLAWTGFEYKRRLDLVEQLQARLTTVGVPREHLFWGSRRTRLMPAEDEQLRVKLDEARRALSTLSERVVRLAEFLRIEPPKNRNGCAALLRSGRRAASSVAWRDADLRSDDWQSRAGEVQELLKAGTALGELRQQYDNTLIPDAWDQDLRETRQDLNIYGRHWWRFFSPTYYRVKRRVASLCRGAAPRGVDAQVALLDGVLEAKRYREALKSQEATAERLFGTLWRGERSSWPALNSAARAIRQLRDDAKARRVPEGLVDFLATKPDLQGVDALAVAVKDALSAHQDTIRQLITFLDLDEKIRFGTHGFDGLEFGAQGALLDSWLARSGELRNLVALNFLAEGCRKEGLAEVVKVAESWPKASQHLARAFQRWRYSGLLEHAYRERPALAGFEGQGQEHTIAKFRELDRLSLKHAQTKLAHEHWQTLPRHDGGGQLGVLRREFEKKSRHLPVRQLMIRAGNAVQAIKPVFMMSPMSVALYLPPGVLDFDLVVFDEASQVRPVDALGALLRGRKAIVVGDSRQLPPTRFFDRLVGDDEGDDDAAETSRDVESILGLFVSQGAPQRMLKWHYRSRHESLIAVSNHEFYNDRLVVFPSPDAGRSDGGLMFRHLPQTSYDRGKTRTNPGEAEIVAQAVMTFAREQLARPRRERMTLGVAAFSMSQMQAISDLIERLRRSNHACEEFFAESGVEPFFVKNLENVQGDERDVIFISVGYGRTAEGSVAMNFGPLNNDGGERRLNVLITRARRRCEVFTNLTADDIDLERTNSRGVRALKTFFQYAQRGVLDVAEAHVSGADAPFEQAVQAALIDAGQEVRAKVGAGEFHVDLAIVDPDRPGRYALGVACDGATYQSARTARDRDRLRQQVLENLGWRIHRIWSAEWFRNPEGELKRLLARLAGEDPVETPETPPPAIEEVHPEGEALEAEESEEDEGNAGERPAGIPAYQFAKLAFKLGQQELHEVPIPRMASWIADVTRGEGPVHPSEVLRRIADAGGVKRAGSRIQSTFDVALEYAVRQNTIKREGEFLWPADMTVPVVRDRSELPSAARRLELVAPEEIAQAIERVVVDAFGMEPKAVPSAACRLLGFGRVGDEMRRRVETIVEEMVESKRLVVRGEHLVIPDLKVAS